MSETNKLTGLEALQVQFEDLNLDLLTKTLSTDLGDVDEGVDEIMEVTGKIQSSVANILKLKASADDYVAGIQDPMRKRIATGELKRRMDEANGQLELMLNHEVEYFRLAAALAYIQYSLCQVFKSPAEAQAMMADLIKRGLVVEAENGPITIGYKRYHLGEEFGFQPEDAKGIAKWAGEYTRRHMILIKEDRRASSKQLQSEATITPDEVWDTNKMGICLFRIPAESFMKWMRGEEKEQWRGGGPLQVQVTQKDLIPLSGKGGSLERQVQNLRDADVRLPRHTIKWDCPPGGVGGNSENARKVFQRAINNIMEFHDLTYEEAEAHLNKVRMLWYLINRAYCATDAAEKQAEVLEELSQQKTISAEAFYGLNGSPQPQEGDALLEAVDVCFQVQGRASVYSPFALVRRFKEEDRSMVEVLRIPAGAHDLLGGFLGKKYPDANNFRGLPGYLARFLHAAKGHVQMNLATSQE